MDKIKQLMTSAGLSEEAASKICESLDAFANQRKQELEEQFKARLTKAKKVCLEEVETHKRELSRRFQIFVEAKTKHIEESLRRQLVDKETEATATLERISTVLEGVEINGKPNSELKAENMRLGKRLQKIQEERDRAVVKANQSNQLAEKVMKRNRQLERSIAEGKQAGSTTQQPQQKGRRLDEGRTNGKSSTTRRTLVENQAPNRATQQVRRNGEVGPADIAESMDITL